MPPQPTTRASPRQCRSVGPRRQLGLGLEGHDHSRLWMSHDGGDGDAGSAFLDRVHGAKPSPVCFEQQGPSVQALVPHASNRPGSLLGPGLITVPWPWPVFPRSLASWAGLAGMVCRC